MSNVIAQASPSPEPSFHTTSGFEGCRTVPGGVDRD
jgi:hypothetical protein